MRKIDLDNLNKPYKTEDDYHRRLSSALGADVPSVGKLAKEIFDDLDQSSFGIFWWNSMPTEERILVSDYLYQCVDTIETNLVEAKLHYLEWLGSREKSNEQIVNSIIIDSNNNFDLEFPPSIRPTDDLPKILESLHICGFFRAIGSTLDCLGTAIIGVLALPCNLRTGDIGKAENILQKIKRSGVVNLQMDFLDFYETAKTNSGATDWLEWADQNRNMFVHRGRRTTFNNIQLRDVQLLDSKGLRIPRAESTTHLSKSPYRTDIEAFIKSKDICLNEDADITLKGIFKSCREFVETITEKLLDIWEQRSNSPNLLDQPQSQWSSLPKSCNFNGYDSNSQSPNHSIGGVSDALILRMLSAAVFDHQRKFWENSKWK